MARCLRSWPAFMPSGACAPASFRSCATTRTRRPNASLQTIWQHQRLLRDQLKTLDGQPVRILHPGFRSVEGGPDFRGAIVQLGDSPPRTGDVEVDLRASGWRAHGHDRNPAFQNVILHVIWDGEQPATGAPPTLAAAPGAGCSARRAQPVAGRRGGANAAGRIARRMLRPVARRAAGAGAGPAPPGGARAIAEQGRAVSGPRPAASAGSNRCGKASSAPWATNTTSGPCSAWPNCARAGSRPAPSRSPCRRACSASAACCRRS